MQWNALLKKYWFDVLGFVLLSCLYCVGISAAGLPSFDANYNGYVVAQIANNDWSNWFNHASPLYFLFFVPFYAAFKNFALLQVINACVFAFSILVCIRIIKKYVPMDMTAQCFALVGMGMSSVAMLNAYGFSIESFGILFAMLIVHFYYQSFFQQKLLYTAATLAAIGLCINYKLFLLLAVLVPIEILQLHCKRSFILYIKALLCFVAPFLLITAWSIYVGLKPLLFAAIWYHLLIARVPNPAGFSLPLFHDIAFYFQYLLRFEPAIWLMSWIVGLVFLAKRASSQTIAQIRKPDFMLLAAIVSVLYFMAISALPKAPRGLLIGWPMYTIVAIWGWQQIAKKMKVRVQYLLVLAFACWSLVNAQQNVWQYRNSSHAQVAERIQQLNASAQFGTTVGINVFQHFPEQPLRFAFTRDKATQFDFLLLDDYRLLAALPIFKDTLEIKNAGYQLVGQWNEAALLSPILWLEHCEFTNISFTEALHKRDSLAQQKYQLRLYKKMSK